MPERSIALATIGAAHGMRGEVRVKSFTADPAALDSYGPLRSDDGRTFEIERLRPVKGDMLVVKFRGVDDRTAAEKLNRLTLYVERSALPAGRYRRVLPRRPDRASRRSTPPATPLGTVTAVWNHGAGDILEIAPPGAARGASQLVPFTKACVPDIDIEAGRMVVVLPHEVEAKEDEEET